MQELDSTLGAAFLGSFAAAILYGVTSVQTFLYFQGAKGDGRVMKCTIFLLWILDTTHTAITAHGIYFYLVTNFGNFAVLEAPTWSVLGGVYLTNLSDIIVRGFFARRVRSLCGHGRPVLRNLLPIIITILSIVVFVCGTGFASKSFSLGTFERMATVDYLLYISFAAAVASDSLVAISLCSLLFWSRTGIKRTDSILTILMAFTINTGLLTSICAMACLITYAIWPQRFIFMGLYFALSKRE
ncbi:hypothetical protein CPC08DRAFT_302520 [Agrocybe pediades]|nr:hypothetical protein CPC08DRAFT_302520 [Agrocybe pediades]